MRALMLYDETERTKKTATRRRRPTIPDNAYGFIDMGNFSDMSTPSVVKENPYRRPSAARLLRRLATLPSVARDEEEE